MVKAKICARCGKEFTPKSNRAKYCSKECADNVRQEYFKERYAVKKESETRKLKTETDPMNLCTEKCNSCKYRGQINSIIEDSRTGRLCCNYLSITGHARSLICPAGRCTVYEKGDPERGRNNITTQDTTGGYDYVHER